MSPARQPWFFAVYLLGTELFAVKLGAVPDPDAEKPRLQGGEHGSHELGFGIMPWDVVAGGKDDPSCR